jgi:phenylalanyl-tRNA synthetase beta chain
MKFPLSLLKHFLDTHEPVEALAARLTDIGLEVESVENPAAMLGAFEVAHIKSAQKHPNADKLQVCQVETSAGMQQIVCGAPNARAGLKVVLAPVGSVIPTNGMKIKASKIRDIESNGMLCSASELGLGEDSAGIIELQDNAKLGDKIIDVLQLDDPVFDIAITPNRGDCFGVMGVARDLAAAGMGTFKQPDIPTIHASGACPISITIEDTEGCPAFIGRAITGVKNGPSPEWLQRTLTACGMRPISVLVDITNYFTVAFGRPLHVYDMGKISGNITVRSAKGGEPFAALNEKTYSLTPHDCVIADENNALDIAGIMGSEDSGVSDTTTDILLEVALFNPIRIAQTGQHHQITSDARMRFERGVDTVFAETADAMATQMILEFCGGNASERYVAGAIPSQLSQVPYDITAINHRAGMSIPQEEADKILTALGFTIQGGTIAAPSWRHDISCEEDIAEEVLRVIGYNAIPTVSLPKYAGNTPASRTPKQLLEITARRTMATRGLHETVSYGFVSREEAEHFANDTDTLQLLQNPISHELSVMRPRLLPHLLRAVSRNQKRGQNAIHLFELGSIFPAPQLEYRVLTAVRAGSMHAVHWTQNTPADMYDIKADMAAALALYGLNINTLTIGRNVPGIYHPGRAGSVGLGPKKPLGVFGELHPNSLRFMDIDGPVMAFELYLDALPTPKPTKPKALKTSDFQAVERDFAFLVDTELPSGDLLAAVNKSDKKLLKRSVIFDVYQGKGVPEGKKSIALTITLQADNRTLTDAEIDTICSAVIGAAGKLGAELRG